MDVATLKNGNQEVESLVRVTMISLRSLMETQPTAFYDLVMICRDPDYRPWGGNGEVLRKAGMFDVGSRPEYPRPHSSIRNIVLSAVEGDGLSMRLVSPFMEPVGGGLL